MRYARHLVALVAVAGLAGAANATPQAADENQPAPMDQDQVTPPTPSPPPTIEEVPPPPPQQTTVIVVPPAQPQPVYAQPQKRRHHKTEKWERIFSPYQTALTVGGGVSDFVDSGMASAVQTGASWDARVTVGTRSVFAFEAGYAGTLNRLEGPSSNEPYLASHGLESDLRINLLPWRVEPYIFGGVGYNHMNLGNRDSDPAMAAKFRSSDDMLMVPAGAGLSGYIGRHATLDARFTYRAMFNQNIALFDTNQRADQWKVNLAAGYAF